LETERLILREATPDDAPFVLALLTDPAFLEMIGDRGVTTVDEARAYIGSALIFRYSEGLGFNVVEVKGRGEPVGTCGLVKREGLDDPDVGYAFLTAAVGHGYASEAVRATLEHACRDLGLTRVAAIVSPHNHRSIRVLEGAGLHRERLIRLAEDAPELLLYATG
jgi:RimJ/RimL family protein N-acetyltransferase